MASSPGGVIGNWKPQNPEDPYGTQIFQGGQNWNLAKSGPGQGIIPYLQTYGGERSPYDDSTAQILDAMRISGLLNPTPANPMMSRTAGYKPGDAWSWDPHGPLEAAPNQAGRYSFGGGGGYGGMYGLLGRSSGNPNTGGNTANGFQPRAGGGPPGAPPVVTDGAGFLGGGNPNVAPPNGGAYPPGSPGSGGAQPPQMQNFNPAGPMPQNAQDLAMLSRVPGIGGQHATTALAGLLGQDPSQGGGRAAQAINQYGDASVMAQPISLLSMGQDPAALIAQAQQNPALWASWQANGINLGRLQGLQAQLQQLGGIRGPDPTIGVPSTTLQGAAQHG